MSDLRYDPIFGQWACIAERRQTRPFEFQQFTQRRAGIDCPFCRGNESVTPPAIAEWCIDGPIIDQFPPEQQRDWLIRVLPNKYPAFDSSLEIRRISGGITDSHLATEIRKAYGDVGEDEAETPASFLTENDNPPEPNFQEVIVLSPRHVVSLSGLSDDELFTSFAVFQDRVAHHAQRPEIRHVCLFMNCRPLAGASIEHSHFQLIASPVCTDQVRLRMARMSEGKNGLTTWRSLLRWELDRGEGIIQDSPQFQVFCPFASRYSHQIRIAPKMDMPFPELRTADLQQLARLCRRWIDGIERCLDDPAYNLIFHLPPTRSGTGTATGRGSAWFVDLVPRFPQAAGFELATDCWVNPVAPETAAGQFRRFDHSN